MWVRAGESAPSFPQEEGDEEMMSILRQRSAKGVCLLLCLCLCSVFAVCCKVLLREESDEEMMSVVRQRSANHKEKGGVAPGDSELV